MSARLDHDRAFELIPWLTNGTLPAAERAAVEEHARSCVTCRLELKEQQSLRAAVQAQPTVHTSAAQSFDRLLARVDGAAAKRGGARVGQPGPLGQPGKLIAPRMRFAAAAGAIVVVLAVAAVTVFAPAALDDRAGYSTLSDSPATGSAVELDLVFAATVSADERQRIVDGLGATVVTGPSAIGRYRVRLAAARSDEALAALLASLGRDPRIRFAGRALDEPAPP